MFFYHLTCHLAHFCNILGLIKSKNYDHKNFIQVGYYVLQNEVSPDKLLHDISSVLNQRKKLHSQVQKLETEVQSLETVTITQEKASLPTSTPVEIPIPYPPSSDSELKKPVTKPSHPMPNFEDRIKSIITSALNEDSLKEENPAARNDAEHLKQAMNISGEQVENLKVNVAKEPVCHKPTKGKKASQDQRLMKVASEMTNGGFYSPVSRPSTPDNTEDEKLKKQKVLAESRFVCDKASRKQTRGGHCLEEFTDAGENKQSNESKDEKLNCHMLQQQPGGDSPSDKSSKSNGLILKLGSLIQSASSGSSPKYEHDVTTGKNKRSKRKKSSPYHHNSSPPKRQAYMDENLDLSVITSSATVDTSMPVLTASSSVSTNAMKSPSRASSFEFDDKDGKLFKKNFLFDYKHFISISSSNTAYIHF